MNPNADVPRAVDQLRRAAELLASVAALPIAVGSRVVWSHNGVVWERVTGDAWKAVSREGEPLDPTAPNAPSSHVASIPFEELG